MEQLLVVTFRPKVLWYALTRWSEAALLAALPKAPSKYNPYRNNEVAKFRRDLVLKNLLENDFLDSKKYQKLKKYELPSGEC